MIDIVVLIIKCWKIVICNQGSRRLVRLIAAFKQARSHQVDFEVIHRVICKHAQHNCGCVLFFVGVSQQVVLNIIIIQDFPSRFMFLLKGLFTINDIVTRLSLASPTARCAVEHVGRCIRVLVADVKHEKLGHSQHHDEYVENAVTL